TSTARGAAAGCHRGRPPRGTGPAASATQDPPLGVRAVVADQVHDAVDQRPDAQPATGEELRDADAHGPDVETADAEAAEEQLQDTRDDLRLVGQRTAVRVVPVGRVGVGGVPGVSGALLVAGRRVRAGLLVAGLLTALRVAVGAGLAGRAGVRVAVTGRLDGCCGCSLTGFTPEVRDAGGHIVSTRRVRRSRAGGRGPSHRVTPGSAGPPDLPGSVHQRLM